MKNPLSLFFFFFFFFFVSLLNKKALGSLFVHKDVGRLLSSFIFYFLFFIFFSLGMAIWLFLSFPREGPPGLSL
jgi:hypothetical protein